MTLGFQTPGFWRYLEEPKNIPIKHRSPQEVFGSLGWCPPNKSEHMSHFKVYPSLPKTPNEDRCDHLAFFLGTLYHGIHHHLSPPFGRKCCTWNPIKSKSVKWYGQWQPKSRWWQLKDFLFSSRNLGKMNPFWRAYFFKWGWFNHQLEIHYS